MTSVIENAAPRSLENQAVLLRRYAECAAFVLFWMAAGFYFRLGSIAFQLLGIPLVVAFQWFIARRSLAQLWVRDAADFRLDRRTVALALALGGLSLTLLLLQFGRVSQPKDKTALLLVLATSVLPAAYAWRHQSLALLRRAWPIIAAAIGFRLLWYAGWAPTHDGALWIPLAKLPHLLSDFVCELIVLHLVDEVVFRGLLDSHLFREGQGRLHAWATAIFVAMLWGVWHLPAYHPEAKSFWALLGKSDMFTVGVVIGGVLLSFCARRCRTLAPSAALHALGNAYVLTLMG